MGEVVSIRDGVEVGPPGEQQPNAEVITQLEEWVERARRGEIIAVALVGASPDGTGFQGWTGGGCTIVNNSVMSSLCVLQYRFAAWLHDGADAAPKVEAPP